MTTFLRRLASPLLFTTSLSTAGNSAFNVRPQGASCSGQDERQASVGAARILHLSTILIDMQVKDYVSHTRLSQKFLSTDNSSAMEEASCSFRIPDEAAVTSFKLEIGDDHAIEDESRPFKRARTIYNQAIRNKTPAAVLREVEPGVFEANLGHIPPDVEVTIVVNFAERMRFNARGDLIIKYPALSPLDWYPSLADTRITIKIEIIQRGLITISSPTHQKLLSINAGVISGAREAESFASLQQPAEEPDSDRPNSASVSLSANRTALLKDFELVIETSNESQRTFASLSTTNRFGHAVLFVTFRPCDLFTGEKDIQWSINIDLDHPWNRCSVDLREMNLTRIQTGATSLSPSKFHFIQSPRVIPKISHWQSYSAFFLLDFGNSSELFLDSVSITATSTRDIYTTRLSVERTNTTDSTLQKLCVSSILRDAYSTLMSKKPHHAFADSRSLSSSKLVKSAERLGQMYSACNHWTSKIAADSICDPDDDIDSYGPQIFQDDLSRLALPTDFSVADNGTLSLPHSNSNSKPQQQQRKRSPAWSEDDDDDDDGGLLVEYPDPAQSAPTRGQDFSPAFPTAIRRFSEFVRDEGPESDEDADAEYEEEDTLGEEEDDVSGKGGNGFKLPSPVTAGDIDIGDEDFEAELEKELEMEVSGGGDTEIDVSEDDGVSGEGGNGFDLPIPVVTGGGGGSVAPPPQADDDGDDDFGYLEMKLEMELEMELPKDFTGADMDDVGGDPESDVSEDDDISGEGGNGFDLPTPVTAAASVSHRRSDKSPKGSNTDRGFGCNPHGVSATERLPPPISNPSVGIATPVEERPQPSSIEFASYVPEAEPFNFDTLPQEIHLEKMDAMDYSYYSPVDDAIPVTDPGLYNSPITFQDASTTDYQWDEIFKLNQTQDIGCLNYNRGETSSAKGEVVTNLAESLTSQTPPTSCPMHRKVSKAPKKQQRRQSSPPPPGHQTLQPPSQSGMPQYPFTELINPEDHPFHFPSPPANSLPPYASYQPTYCPPSDLSGIQPYKSDGVCGTPGENHITVTGPPQFGIVPIDEPKLPPMTHFADAYRAPNLNTGNAPFETCSSYEDCDLDIHWEPQANDSYPYLSSNMTYTLQVDLRNRIGNRFQSGTRVWLVERIKTRTHSIYDAPVLEAVVDTMLVLVFVKACLAQRYGEVEEHVGLVLDSWQNQKTILDELTLRMMGEEDNNREERDEALSTDVLEFLSL